MINKIRRLYYNSFASHRVQLDYIEKTIEQMAKQVNNNVGEFGAMFLSNTDFILFDKQTYNIYLFVQLYNTAFDAIVCTNKLNKIKGVEQQLCEKIIKVIDKRGGDVIQDEYDMALIPEEQLFLLGPDAKDYIKNSKQTTNIGLVKKEKKKNDD